MAVMLATDTRKQILIVDRDMAVVEPLRQKLCDAGFAVNAVTDASAAVAAVAARPPHLVIIDWNMPGFAALELIACVRRARMPRQTRLIIVSALPNEPDVVAALNLGADDYIAKPFSLREVVARVSAVLRSFSQEPAGSLTCDELALDASTNQVMVRGRVLNLRGVEYRLLEILMSHAGKIFNRAQLVAQVWGADSQIDERTVDVHVQRLRKILTGPGYEAHIQTVRGFGYRFAQPGARPVGSLDQ
jgi:two-component system, OmpR family, phosphate regulon response regulator PhoB